MTASILKKVFKSRLFIIIMALVCTGAVFYIAVLNRTDIPGWVTWDSGTFHDSTGRYEIELRRKSVNIKYDDAVTWSSPDGVKVQQALSCDIDNDGYDELILLCWRQGRFGAHKPFWIDDEANENDEWSQHIFVYEYGRDIDMTDAEELQRLAKSGMTPVAPGEIHAKWQSSYIGQDVAEIAVSGSEAPHYRLMLTAPDRQVSIWFWDSWGFVKEDSF